MKQLRKPTRKLCRITPWEQVPRRAMRFEINSPWLYLYTAPFPCLPLPGYPRVDLEVEN